MKCNVCDNEIPQFVREEQPDKSFSLTCPICRSVERHRALLKGFSSLWGSDIRLVHVGPHSAVVRHFWETVEQRPNFAYLPVDFKRHMSQIVKIDLESPNVELNPADLVICLHVLDTVLDENTAMENITRWLKTSGKLIFDVPLQEGKTDRGYEKAKDNKHDKNKKKKDQKVITESERESKFGNKLKLRKYGQDDILDFVDSFGFKSTFETVSKDDEIGIESDYKFIVGIKQ